MLQLSIIVTVYNAQEYLSACIASLLQQRNVNYEIILVDDGSCDSSGDICDYYSAAYDEITTIHQSNLGLVESRNVGIRVSRGKYISFVDADDWLDADFYPDYIRKMDSDEEISIAITGAMKVTVTGNTGFFYLPHKDIMLTANEALNEMFHRVIFGWELWGKIYRRKVIEKVSVDATFSIGEDLERNFSLWKNVNKVWFSCARFYHYRVHSESMTRTVNVLDRNLWMLFDKIYRSDSTTLEVKLLAKSYLAQEYVKRMITMFFTDRKGFYEDIKILYIKIRKLMIDINIYQRKNGIASNIMNSDFSTWYEFFSLKFLQIEQTINNVSVQFESIFIYYIDNDTKFLDCYLRKHCKKYGGMAINYTGNELILGDRKSIHLNLSNRCDNILLLLPTTSKNFTNVNRIANKLNTIPFFQIDIHDFI